MAERAYNPRPAMSARSAVSASLAAGNFLGPPINLFATEPYRPIRIAPGTGAYHDEVLESTWDSDRAVAEGLKLCSVLATLVFEACEMAASVPWYWYREVKSGREEKLEPVEFIEYPRLDGNISRFSMIDEFHHHGFLSGNGIIGIGWEGGSRFKLRPREMQVENPHGCNPVVHREQYITAYEWDDASLGGRRRWDASDVVHVIMRRDPKRRYWGYSILEPLAATIDADIVAHRMKLKRLMRGAYPAMIVKDEDLDRPEDCDEAERRMNLKAEKQFGSIMVIGGKQEIHDVKMMKDADLGLLAGLRDNRDEIARALGFHPAMVSSDAATFNNFKLGRELLWMNTVLKNSRLADALSVKLVRGSDRGKLFVAPDYSEVEELNRLDIQINRTADLVSTCRVRLNDAIAVTGLPIPEQEGGDRPLVQNNLIPAGDAAESLNG